MSDVVKERVSYLELYCTLGENFRNALNILSEASYDLHGVGGSGEDTVSLPHSIIRFHLKLQNKYFGHDLRAAIKTEKAIIKSINRQAKRALKNSVNMKLASDAALPEPSKAVAVSTGTLPVEEDT